VRLRDGLVGVLLGAVTLAALRLWGSSEGWRDALIAFGVAVAWLVLWPSTVYVWSLIAAPHRILRDEVLRLSEAIKTPDTSGPKPLDASTRELVARLRTLADEGWLIHERRSRGDALESDAYQAEVHDWGNRVAAELVDPVHRRQFVRDAAYLLNDMTPASTEIEHKMKMLTLILKSLTGNLE
jgi:hypothetical protein